MLRNTEDKGAKQWSISLGFYPVILFGMRSYHGETHNQTVIYLPFIDLAIEIEK